MGASAPAVDLKAAQTVATTAARAAGAIQRAAFGGAFAVEKKGLIDLITEVDTACETTVVKALTEAFPEHGLLGEEGSSREGAVDARWIIDPLDGTTNFAHGFPFFCVSIGLEVAGVPTLGVVYAPILDELFVAVRGQGATRNGTAIGVSTTDTLIASMLCTGFPYHVNTGGDDNLIHFGNFTRRAQASRRTGSAALDLCYVAMGRFDGFWEAHLKPWDVAAGVVVVAEGGGTVSRYDGSPHRLDGAQVLASNGKIHPAMMDVLAGKLDGEG